MADAQISIWKREREEKEGGDSALTMTMTIGKKGESAVAGVIPMIAVMAAVLTCAECRLIKVGGAAGWTDQGGVNYTLWSNNQTIYAGDWLQFVFDKTRYNVLQVNKSSYGNCTDQGFIKNITRGGRDVFQLTEPHPYYFLSGGGFCFNGMKLSVDVQTAPPPSPSPIPSKAGPPSTNRFLLALFTALISASIKFGGGSGASSAL